MLLEVQFILLKENSSKVFAERKQFQGSISAGQLVNIMCVT